MGGASVTAGKAGGGDLIRGSVVGRYVVLSTLGFGNMGVVYAAYDPELDRKVALKLLRSELREVSDNEARTRLLREAQALAKLSHPNVVAVYDVGAIETGVWLAMEFVEGQTLDNWCKERPRSWREALDVMRHAGRGLQAAHHAGLIHRDFKPENVMVGTDGRVRVMDLGLARLGAREDPVDLLETLAVHRSSHSEQAALAIGVTQAGAIVGTPAYMAPEQFQGLQVGVAADVFAFCVTCWEAIVGERPFAGTTLAELLASVFVEDVRPIPKGKLMPVWVRKALRRGIQRGPEARWPSMGALLAVLAHDPRQARRRWLAAGTLLLGVAGIGYGVAASSVAEAQQCRGAAEELLGTWDAEQRDRMTKAMRATGVAYAEKVAIDSATALNAYSQTWVAAHTTACDAHRRGHVSALLFDRRMACLRQRRVDLAATVAVLREPTRETIVHALDTVAGLPKISACEDDERLLADAPPPEDPVAAAAVASVREQMARPAALERNGQYAQALAELRPLMGKALLLDHAPLYAEVHLLAGKLHMQRSELADARAELSEALHLGVAVRVDAVAAEALVVRIFVDAIGEHPKDALADAGLAWALVERVGSPPLLAALLHNNIATVHYKTGALEMAVAAYEQGHALLLQRAPEDPLRWVIVFNLSQALLETGRHDRARELLQEALPASERRHADCHPVVASLRMMFATADALTARFDQALNGFEQAVACHEKEHPAYAVSALVRLASMQLVMGDEVQTRWSLSRIDRLLATAPDSALFEPMLDLLRADVELHAGQLAQARVFVERAQAQTDPDPQVLGAALMRLGLLAHLEHRDPQAHDLLTQAEALLRYLRLEDRGLLAFTQARTERALGRPPEQVATLARKAIETYELAGPAYGRQVAEIRAWLGEPVSAGP